VTKVDGRVIGAGKLGAMTAKLTALYHTEIDRAVTAAKAAK
jgi:hypothetical protein